MWLDFFSLRCCEIEPHPAGLFPVALIHASVNVAARLHQRTALSCVRFAFMINARRLIYLRAQQLGSPNQASINCAQKLQKREGEKRTLRPHLLRRPFTPHDSLRGFCLSPA